MINSVVTRLSTGTYTVTRTPNGTLANGKYTPSASPTTTPIVAVVEPYANGRHVMPLPIGMRAEDVRIVMTTFALRTRDDAGEADIVTIGGEPFHVFAVEGPWTLRGASHYEAYAARKAKP